MQRNQWRVADEAEQSVGTVRECHEERALKPEAIPERNSAIVECR
jgi:hypothetical protein